MFAARAAGTAFFNAAVVATAAGLARLPRLLLPCSRWRWRFGAGRGGGWAVLGLWSVRCVLGWVGLAVSSSQSDYWESLLALVLALDDAFYPPPRETGTCTFIKKNAMTATATIQQPLLHRSQQRDGQRGAGRVLFGVDAGGSLLAPKAGRDGEQDCAPLECAEHNGIWSLPHRVRQRDVVQPSHVRRFRGLRRRSETHRGGSAGGRPHLLEPHAPVHLPLGMRQR